MSAAPRSFRNVRTWRIAEALSALGDFRTSLQSGLSALMAGKSNEFAP
jgi:hypothetical protein